MLKENIQLGIIIPVYNEKSIIGDTFNAINKEIKTPYRIYIVYDFEEDNTIPVAKSFIQKGLNIIFIRNTLQGVAEAIKKGLREAKEQWLLVSMADLSDDYKVVDLMCELMSKGFDLVCGSRYIKGGSQSEGPIVKKFFSRSAGLSLNYLVGLPTHDVTNSFKLYRKSMLDNLTIESNGGFEIGMEIVIKAYFSGYKVTEVPCVYKDRQKGESRFRIMKWFPKYLKWYCYAIYKSFRTTQG
jgi:glycosyltransferase involved in cell wall biosynthesis